MTGVNNVIGDDLEVELDNEIFHYEDLAYSLLGESQQSLRPICEKKRKVKRPVDGGCESPHKLKAKNRRLTNKRDNKL